MSPTGPAVLADVPVYLVKGDDAALVAQAARGLIEQLVGERDPALVVEELGGSSGDDLDVGVIVDACTTPPFLIDRRVVVVRDAGRLNAGDAARIVVTLADPLPSSILVLVGGGGTVPQALSKAVGAKGQVVDTSAGTGNARKAWVSEHVKDGPVRFSTAAANMIGQHLGEDLGRLAGILETLAAAYGEGAAIGPDELTPFLGEAGGVPPWDLTNAIDEGKPDRALAVLHRMFGAGGRAPIEVLGLLNRHFLQMLALDGAAVATADDAAALLGERHSFVAKRTLDQTRRLGHQRVTAAVLLLADADLDAKGQSALPAELVLEILVARLSRLVRAKASSRR